jgi:hypothetical protein
VFNPFAFVLIAAAWRSGKGRDGGRLAKTVVGVQLGAAFLGLLLHVLPGGTQQNLPWLLFAIPAWLAVALGLWPRRQRSLGLSFAARTEC